jgi:hypothetical protein
MRISPSLPFLLSVISLPVFARPKDGQIPDQLAIDALEQRAIHSSSRDQYFIYTELIHDLIDDSAYQYSAGDTPEATHLLKQAQQLTHKLDILLSRNDKNLKKAQILLRNTTFRLGELLHASDFDDRPIIKQTLSQLDQAQTEAMLQVFSK